MTDLDQFKNFFENAAKSNARALELQTKYFTDYTTRQSETFTKMAADRLKSLQDMGKNMGSGGDMRATIEKSMAFEEDVRMQLDELQQANNAAFEELSNELKSLYSVEGK